MGGDDDVVENRYEGGPNPDHILWAMYFSGGWSD